MPAFEVSWVRWLIGVVAIGIGVILFIFLGFYLPSRSGRPPMKHQETEKWPAGLEVLPGGVPPVMILLYVLMGAYIVWHMLYMWLAPVTY